MSLRTTIAATTTVLALGGLTAVALSAGGAEPQSAAAQPQPISVRTQVVERVEHRTRQASAPGVPQDDDRDRSAGHRRGDARGGDDDDRGEDSGRGRGGDHRTRERGDDPGSDADDDRGRGRRENRGNADRADRGGDDGGDHGGRGGAGHGADDD